MFTPQLDNHMIDYILDLRVKLSRVIAVINGKGGQGKTTTVAQLGGLMAAALASEGSSRRVLVMELDDQGDLCMDLGIKAGESDDDGANMLQACMGLDRLRPVREVRPNLDIVPGGKHLKKVSGALSGEQGDAHARLRLASQIAEISHLYDWILIDCPPKVDVSQDLALVAARWTIIPVSFDASSIYGMSGVAERLSYARQINPDLDVLGVLIYGLPYQVSKDKETGELREVGLRTRVRQKVFTALEESGVNIPVFETTIRENKTVAEACRDLGRLVHEVAASDGPKKFGVLRGRTKGRRRPKSEAGVLSQEWEDLGAEAFGMILDREAEIGNN